MSAYIPLLIAPWLALLLTGDWRATATAAFPWLLTTPRKHLRWSLGCKHLFRERAPSHISDSSIGCASGETDY